MSRFQKQIIIPSSSHLLFIHIQQYSKAGLSIFNSSLVTSNYSGSILFRFSIISIVINSHCSYSASSFITYSFIQRHSKCSTNSSSPLGWLHYLLPTSSLDSVIHSKYTKAMDLLLPVGLPRVLGDHSTSSGTPIWA